MLKNYFKIAWRNLNRDKSYSVINIVGLSVAIICFIFIFLFIRHEYSYDRFHSKSDHIYRVLMSNQFGGTAMIPAVTNETIAHFPEVKNSVRLYRSSKVILSDNNEVMEEKNFFYTDPSFFNVFSFSLLQGNPASALSEPNTIILTQSASKKYFGRKNPLGETITLNNNEAFRVTGVMEDTPSNSHLEIDFLASFSSLGTQKGMDDQGFLYLLLHNSGEVSTFQSKLNQLAEGSLEEISQKFGFAIRGMGFELQPLTNIHLYPALNGNIKAAGDLRYLYIFGAIGIFILGIACINYMNLAIAKSLNRAREVGMRKTLGAQRRQLAGQFLLESMLISAIAFLLALAAAQILLPTFEKFLGVSIQFFDLVSYPFILGSVLFILILGLLSGSYPVAVLTRFSPIEALNGSMNTQAGNPMIRKGLVVFQFMISIFLITGTLIVKNQLDFIQDKKLGYETEHILSLPMTESFRQRLSEGQLQPDQQKITTFKQQFSKIPGVWNVSAAYDTPNGYLTSEVEYQDESYSITSLPVDFDYLETMNLKLDSGRDFEIGRSTDSTKAIIVNKTAARLFNLEDKVGETLNINMGLQNPFLIGIVEDFHTASFHHTIGPAILQIQPTYYNSYILRIEKGSLPNVITQLETTWKSLAPMHPFSYSFLDDELQKMYESEQQLGNMFSTFSLITILIACLGLLGLSAFMIKQKTKEIGIRKVLGASVANIVALLSKDFVKLVILGFVIAIPIAWYAMNQWLADFAYRIQIGPGIFVLAGSAALVIALLTVSWQSIKAALANPVESLRSE